MGDDIFDCKLMEVVKDFTKRGESRRRYEECGRKFVLNPINELS